MTSHKFIAAEVRPVPSVVCCLCNCIISYISFIWPPIIIKNASIDAPVGIIVI
jgi:hypothetical protein